ncbi:hypothetical protein SAY86_003286 [Trapa natans]|uniref:AMP-dependent synthetase/ligase domain-containing protein n=1 Tax=Trapa natans TaxID=22666 RepID=A0AAN7MDC4_TRANT|nr:hypothetical protein SAY86_003286 [Trapa natans]
MADTVNPQSGFCSSTGVFHSLRPHVLLPPLAAPFSVTDYAASLLPPSSSSTTFAVNATTGVCLTYSDLISQIRSLALSLTSCYSLSKGDVAFILSPPSVHVPILYLSLMSLGVIVSPANPLSSPSELAHMVRLCRPVIAFATSSSADKLPQLRHGTILIDSPDFGSMLSLRSTEIFPTIPSPNRVKQSDPAAILYSSGTTGRVKGVLLTHRNLVALLAGYKTDDADGELIQEPKPHPVSLFTLPLFHVFGFFMLIRAFAFGETIVLMEKFDFVGMLKAVEKYRVTYMPVAPPLIVAFVKSDATSHYDLSSLILLGCGGAPLGKEIADQFKEKFPHVEIIQGYGMTETTGGATRAKEPEESAPHGSVGRLAENMEAKIVDPVTGDALGPGQRGELWLRGPTIMKGYVGDDKATAETLDADGWLRTGDLCYFDFKGFLYIVDRLKELIKYKAYQVAPAELEHLLHTLPEIADAAVIPYFAYYYYYNILWICHTIDFSRHLSLVKVSVSATLK